MASTLRSAALLAIVLCFALSLPRSGADAADNQPLRRLSGTITPLSVASFAIPTTKATASTVVTPLATTASAIKIRPQGHRRHGNLCSSSTQPGMAHCHAKVLLAKDFDGDAAPVAAAALKLAFQADSATLGPNNKPASIPDAAPGGRRLFASGSVSYKPQQLQQVYQAGKAATKCQTVAIIGAYHYKNAQSDLSTFRAKFGLPALTVRFFDQNGGTSYAGSDDGWAGEEMLDLSIVSAICPCCPIWYFGAVNANMDSLDTAIKSAVRLGARVVSMSWGGAEDGVSDSDDRDTFAFSGAAGVVFTASSGDDGFAGGTSYPASSAYVIGVGGTSLLLDANNNRKSETVWSSAGSGCSASISKPSWQTNSPGCSKRMVADVSAVADPNTGVLVYFKGSYYVYGGTSAAAPIIAAMYAGGWLGSIAVSPPARGLYPGGQDYATLKDITSGSNGPCSGVSSYFCNGVVGYDGPTGNGVPTSTGGSTGPVPNPTPTPTPTPIPVAPTPAPTPAPTGGDSSLSNMHLVTGQDAYGNYLCYGIQNSQLKQLLCDDTSAAQSFAMVATTNGWYFIKSAAARNACLGVSNSNSGSSVVLQTCSGSVNQAFGFFDLDSSSTYFHLRPKANTRLCLGVNGASSYSGAVIVASTCSSNPAFTLFYYNP